MNMSVPTCVRFGLVCAVSTHSHSGQLICDIHFGTTHLAPCHCASAVVVYVWDLHRNDGGEPAFSLAWLSFFLMDAFSHYSGLSP